MASIPVEQGANLIYWTSKSKQVIFNSSEEQLDIEVGIHWFVFVQVQDAMTSR